MFEVDPNAAVQYEDFERELLSFDHSLLRHVTNQDQSLPRSRGMRSSASFEQACRDNGALDVRKTALTLHDAIQEEICRFNKAHLRRTITRVYNEPVVIEPLQSVDHASQRTATKRTLSDWLDKPASLESAPSGHAYHSPYNVPVEDASGGSASKSAAFSGVMLTQSSEDVQRQANTVYNNESAGMAQPELDNEYFLAIARQEPSADLVSISQKLTEQASLLLTPLLQQDGNTRKFISVLILVEHDRDI